MARQVYDDSASRSQVALTSEEVDALLLTDGSFFTRDPRRVRHLLTRMKAAFAAHVQQMRDLQRDIEHMHAAARTRANPVSAALEALRNLDLEEQRQVFDIRAQSLVDAVEAAREESERVRTAATSEANRARFALAKVLEDPAVPSEVRAKLEQALRLLPDPTYVAVAADVAQPVVADAARDGGFSVPPRETAPDLSDALFGDDFEE